MDKWIDAYFVYCVNKFDNIIPNSCLKVKGFGDLSFNYSTDKEGFGFCLEQYTYDISDPLNQGKYIYRYYTLDEMNNNFLTFEEYEIFLNRKNKINNILNTCI